MALAVGVSAATWDEVLPGPGEPPELQPDKASAHPITSAAAALDRPTPDRATPDRETPDPEKREVKKLCDVMGRYSPSSFKTACSEQCLKGSPRHNPVVRLIHRHRQTFYHQPGKQKFMKEAGAGIAPASFRRKTLLLGGQHQLPRLVRGQGERRNILRAAVGRVLRGAHHVRPFELQAGHVAEELGVARVPVAIEHR